MKPMFPFVSLPFFAPVSQRTQRHLPARAASVIARLVAIAVGLNAALLAAAQTAHFDGAQTNSINGTTTSTGNTILSIAVDAAGDVYFTAQYDGSDIADRGAGKSQYVPAAFHPRDTRRLWDGRREAGAQKVNASGCTYNGYMSGLYVWQASSNTIFLMSGLSAPYGLALDPKGNLYVLDAYSAAIYEYPAVNGSVSPATAPSFVAFAQGDNCTAGDLARDANGNLYYTTSSGHTVEEMQAVNGAIPNPPTVRTLGSGFGYPVGITVDGSGNVYVGDALNNAVKELVAVNGSIPASPTIRTLGSGFNLPAGLAVDSLGDVYVSDTGNNDLKEVLAVNGTIPSSPAIEVLGTFSGTEAVALDASGDIFDGYTGSNGGTINEFTPSGANFGAAGIGTATAAIPMMFTFDNSATLGGISVLTQGAPGLDYANAGSGTCNAGTAYSHGQSCTVNVSFTPAFSGTRNGAVVLTASNGSVIATGYLQGTGVGPQVSFLPGVQSTVLATGLSGPSGVAVDGSGNVYIADTANNRVLKETLAAGAYTESTVSSDLSLPYGVTVDGSGSVYVADTGNNRVLKETPAAGGSYSESTVASGAGGPMGVAVDASGNVYFTNNSNGMVVKATLGLAGYTQSTLASGLSSPAGLAVDGSGNVFIADTANNRVLKETLSGGSYTQGILPSPGMDAPTGVAADGAGNVYIVFQSDSLVLKETPSGGSYTPSTVVSGLASSAGPFGVAVDSSGNLYVGDAGNNRVLKEDFADPPSLTFANTQPGSTSADSPQTVTIANDGNAALIFPIPASGSNPGIGPDFTLNTSGQADCLLVNSESAGPATLAAGATCQLPVSFTPSASGSLAESLTVTDNNLNAPSPAYAVQTITLAGTSVVQTTPSIAWSAPAAISYGTPLGAAQLDATASVEGTFSYSPAAGTVLGAGAQTLAVTFTPTDTTDYTTATATTTVTVNQATPTISWTAPAAITYGTALSSAQLNASSTVPGTFSYSPAAGTVLGAGAQTLTVTFTPTDTTDYTTATATAPVTVNQATPSISWGAPAAITYGAALSSAQLNASSTVAGTFSYSPAAGAVLTAGSQALTTTFTPTDTTDYTTATSTVTLTVNQATPTITWTAPAAITYGTALSSAQLNASSTVPGTFSYSPAAGTVLGAGAQTLTVTFTPTDTTDYTTATATAPVTVNQATPTISWTAPAAITYGTALGSAQLNASSTVAGTFSYSPSAGTVLTAGQHAITATFTPTDTTDYAPATAAVTLTINQATPTIAWSAPAAITYGTALGSAQLNATSTVAGTFSYSPAAGAVLAAGSQTLTTTFTPTDSTDYAPATASVSLTVSKAAPSVTWPAPAAIVYGTALSSAQLDATAGIAGSFAYSPAAGAVLGAGTQTLSVTFTPGDSTDYNPVTTTVPLTVNKAAPAINWPAPASITAGTPLSGVQLDATASVPGTFAYSPAAGTVLAAGSQTLTTVFTPTDSADYNTTTASVVLQVTAAPSFTLSASSGSLTVADGKTGTDTITVTGQNGFNSSVTLSATGLPSGVTAAFGTNPASGSSVLTFTASSSAAPGTYSVTVKGVSGSLSSSTTISLTIQSGFACHVGYSITNSWKGGFQVALSINNTGTVAISSWKLTWTFANGQTVTQFWNGNESQSGSNVTVTNESYNGSIAAGASYTSAGFNGSWNNKTNAVPASFAINGTACN